jgi:sulfofructose kinase
MHPIDVLCVGHACYDLVFSIDHQPGADEKATANGLVSCGGGTAANAAMTVAKLGYSVAFCGYLGDEIYGHEHLEEMHAVGVNTELVVRGPASTSLSAIFVKPNGARSIVSYKGDTNGLTADDVDFTIARPRVVLFDGHQASLALSVADWAHNKDITTVVDADTHNQGNIALVPICDYIVASERFACEYSNVDTPEEGLVNIAKVAPNVVVTLGERGLIWQRGEQNGHLDAFEVNTVDTTGAGDTFHGAFAAGVAAGMEWIDLLRYASAAGALCCTKHGARIGIPAASEVAALLESNSLK